MNEKVNPKAPKGLQERIDKVVDFIDRENERQGDAQFAFIVIGVCETGFSYGIDERIPADLTLEILDKMKTRLGN